MYLPIHIDWSYMSYMILYVLSYMSHMVLYVLSYMSYMVL